MEHVHARHRLELLHQQVVEGADADARVGLPRLLLQLLYECAQVGRGQPRADDQAHRDVSDGNDRREAAHRVVGQVLALQAVQEQGRGRRQCQRVAVRLGPGHLGGAEDAVGAGLVLEHDRLAEDARGAFRDQASHHFQRRARRIGKHDVDGLVGIRRLLREGWRERQQCGGCGAAGQEGSSHWDFLFFLKGRFRSCGERRVACP
ncbi:hypothetical protein D9M72_535450 [compost metagenome]